MNKRKLFIGLIILFAAATGCRQKGKNIIEEIRLGIHNNNELKIQVDVTTTVRAKLMLEYWLDSSGSSKKTVSNFINTGLTHTIVLCNILPAKNYSYQLVSEEEGVKDTSKIYKFRSRELPGYLQEQFRYSCNNTDLLPGEFKNGLMLMNKRETPGVAYMVDYTGQLRWYHMIDGTGFKVTHFTKDTTLISILGKNDEPTSYGSEILEVNMLGDTLLYLKKGQGDLKYSIHHEIIKRNSNEIVTLFVDKKVMDLTTAGGKLADTVTGDGILILDKKGKKIWQWSVFDVVDPLKDANLLKTKNDWMHANSLSYDADSNFIISFYNNGQIWKVDAASGKVLWKFGKGGDVAMTPECNFSQAHAVHINQQGSLMFFDNGVERKRSDVFAVKLSGANKTAAIDWHIALPLEVYNERMGSAYMVGDTTVLCCCSKKHITVLANKKGELLWTLRSAIPPYRAEFLKAEQVAPYLLPVSSN